MSVKKECCSHQAIPAQPPRQWARRELRIETGCSPLSHRATAAAPHWCTLRRLRTGKLTSDSWGACQRNDFNKPSDFHLPIDGRVLHSLTWDVWFYYLVGIIWCSDNLFLFVCLQNFLYILTPTLFLWSSPSKLSERLYPGLNSLVLFAE